MQDPAHGDTEDDGETYQVLLTPHQNQEQNHLHPKESPGPPPFPFSGTSLQRWCTTPKDISTKHVGYKESLSVSYDQATKLQSSAVAGQNFLGGFNLAGRNLGGMENF